MSNSVDPDEMANYEPSYQDLRCLQKFIIIAYDSERINIKVTNDGATILFYLLLSAAALSDFPNRKPVHSSVLSSHCFFCILLLLSPFTVPCRIVFDNNNNNNETYTSGLTTRR